MQSQVTFCEGSHTYRKLDLLNRQREARERAVRNRTVDTIQTGS